MKLYLEDGEVYFDYSEVDMKATLDNGTTQARRFLLAVGIKRSDRR